jgi:hypothetical protein
MSKQVAKKRAMVVAEELSDLLESFIGVEAQVSFGPHTFDIVLSEVGYATLGAVKELKHKITPVQQEDGSLSNPQHVILYTTTGESLVLQADRIKPRITSRGIQLLQENNYTLTISKKRGK